MEFMPELNIYGTFGPSCHAREDLEKLLDAGATGMRLNLSHGSLKDHEDWIKAYHEAGGKDLLIDMKGPELRVGKDLEPLQLVEDEAVYVERLMLPQVVLDVLEEDKTLLLDDGKIELKMESPNVAVVVQGGLLMPSKSVAVPGFKSPYPALTEEDHENLLNAKEFGVTGIMQPFVRSKEDLIEVREALKRYGLENVRLFAKIESAEGLQQLEQLLPFCDEVIIARGDLANAVGITNIAKIQNDIEDVCRAHQKPWMVVTQMLDSMRFSPAPTRAEITDIYNAVKAGASSIMLTGETASGKYPILAMETFVAAAKTAQ